MHPDQHLQQHIQLLQDLALGVQVVRHYDVIGLLALDLEVEVGEDLPQQVLHAQYEQRDHLFGILGLALILLLVVAFSQQFDQEVANFILESLII